MKNYLFVYLYRLLRKKHFLGLLIVFLITCWVVIIPKLFKQEAITEKFVDFQHVDTKLLPIQTYDVHKYEHQPLLTLITTFKNIPYRRTINENVLKNWPKLPGVQPVVYIEPNDTFFSHLTRSYGWKVYEIPKLKLGYPVLKYMLQHALKNIKPSSSFIGYANSDILFTNQLTTTLQYINRIQNIGIQDHGVFIMGRKINSLVEEVHFDPFLGILTNTLDNPETITYDASTALEYFISSTGDNGFSWNDIPEFVLGKPGYDNWLAAEALYHNHVTIDVTFTVMALHQTMSDVHSDKGWLSKNACMNRDLIDPYNYMLGQSSCFHYFTKFINNREQDNGRRLTLYKRTVFAFDCYPSEGGMANNCSNLILSKNPKSEKYPMYHFK